MARVVEAGILVLGGGALLLAKLGLFDDAASLVKSETPQQLMSSSSPWSKDYDPQAVAPAVYFPNCAAARAAGVAPLSYGDPGYAAHLDRDGDGEACEPYYGP